MFMPLVLVRRQRLLLRKVCGIGRSAIPGCARGFSMQPARWRAVTVEKILRQKISSGVKSQLVARFDRDGNGSVSATEFLNKVVSNPMATLYAFMPSNVCLS